MKFIPFPSFLAEISAANAASSYDARKGLKPGDHTTQQLAAYRMPDGVIRPAYNLYKAEFPEGCTPGLADLTQKLEHYLNDTHGYRTHCTNFVPVDELIAQMEGTAISLSDEATVEDDFDAPQF